MALGINMPRLADIVRNLLFVLRTVLFAVRKASQHLHVALEFPVVTTPQANFDAARDLAQIGSARRAN
jgi:hypothetical protein